MISLDEDEITTSEGQSYAMLRAVWSNDRETFDQVWKWTKDHLRVRGDHLFAWKWKDEVIDYHSATDADTDIAMALLLASRRFEAPDYEREALEVIRDIWDHEILPAGNAFYPTAGDWTRGEPIAVVHIGYLAPYAYQEFAKVDAEHPWPRVVDTSYAILNWLFFDAGLELPPEKIYVDARTGHIALADPKTGEVSEFGYDAFPIYWRLALDASWHCGIARARERFRPGAESGSASTSTERWREQVQLAQLHDRMLAPLRAGSNARAASTTATGRTARRSRTSRRCRSTPRRIRSPRSPIPRSRRSCTGRSSRRCARRRSRAATRPTTSRTGCGSTRPTGSAKRGAWTSRSGSCCRSTCDRFRANFPVTALLLCLALFPLAHFARGTALAVAGAVRVPRERVRGLVPLSLVARNELAQLRGALRRVHQHLAAGSPSSTASARWCCSWCRWGSLEVAAASGPPPRGSSPAST